VIQADDEAEVWADGYSYMEFEQTGAGLVPFHYESRPSLSLPEPLTAMAERDPAAIRQDSHADSQWTLTA